VSASATTDTLGEHAHLYWRMLLKQFLPLLTFNNSNPIKPKKIMLSHIIHLNFANGFLFG
jgi:hypothetical protein